MNAQQLNLFATTELKLGQRSHALMALEQSISFIPIPYGCQSATLPNSTTRST